MFFFFFHFTQRLTYLQTLHQLYNHIIILLIPVEATHLLHTVLYLNALQYTVLYNFPPPHYCLIDLPSEARMRVPFAPHTQPPTNAAHRFSSLPTLLTTTSCLVDTSVKLVHYATDIQPT